MKKSISLIALSMILICILAPCLAGCNNSKKETVFKVFNVQDYIDEDILDEFVDYYKNLTGKTIKIEYDTFDTLERAYTIINNRKADYDVVCPSDYLIEKMKNAKILNELDLTKIPNKKYIAPYLMDRNFDRGNQYSIPYMWGTLGILYNADKIDEQDVGNWNLLWNEKYSNKILMKDSIRDSVFIATIYANREELAKLKPISTPEEYRNRIFELVNNVDSESIKIVEKELRNQYNILYGYEVDSGKDAMVNGEAWINLAWSGDAVWAIDSAKENGINLKYYIPEEGSNVWFDNWVIPKYAKNVDIAHEFINYLCLPEVALKNTQYIGYTTAVLSPEILNTYIDNELENGHNFSYLFDNNNYDNKISIDENWQNLINSYKTNENIDFKNLKLDDVYYPSKDIVDYCVEMSDFGDKQDMVVKMWTRVKASPLSIEVKIFSIILAICIVGLIGYGIYKKIKLKKQRTT